MLDACPGGRTSTKFPSPPFRPPRPPPPPSRHSPVPALNRMLRVSQRPSHLQQCGTLPLSRETQWRRSLALLRSPGTDPPHPRPRPPPRVSRSARGLVGAADGVPHAVDHPQLHGPEGTEGVGLRGGVCGGVVRGGPGNGQRAAPGRDNVRKYKIRRYSTLLGVYSKQNNGFSPAAFCLTGYGAWLGVRMPCAPKRLRGLLPLAMHKPGT